MRPRLVLIAPNMVDVIRCAGGWAFDRVMAGWDVMVLSSDYTDARPLRILGARHIDLECALSRSSRGPGPQAIAVDAGLYDADERVQRMVLDAIDECSAEVRMWDVRYAADDHVTERSVRHRLSVAARAFKAQALAAAAAPADVIDMTERFTSGQPDLIPAA